MTSKQEEREKQVLRKKEKEGQNTNINVILH